LGRFVQPATLTDWKATGTEKSDHLPWPLGLEAMWALHLLMSKSEPFTDVDVSDAEGEF